MTVTWLQTPPGCQPPLDLVVFPLEAIVERLEGQFRGGRRGCGPLTAGLDRRLQDRPAAIECCQRALTDFSSNGRLNWQVPTNAALIVAQKLTEEM